jgi:hypothetical protein
MYLGVRCQYRSNNFFTKLFLGNNTKITKTFIIFFFSALLAERATPAELARTEAPSALATDESSSAGNSPALPAAC